MPTNKRKREDLRRSANAVGQTKLSFKKQKSSVSGTEEVNFIIFFISNLKQFPLAKLLHFFWWYCFIILPSLKHVFLQRSFYITDSLRWERKFFLCDHTSFEVFLIFRVMQIKMKGTNSRWEKRQQSQWKMKKKK